MIPVRLLVCLHCVAAAWMPTSAWAQQLSFTLTEEMLIGDDEDAPAEYLFTGPELVRTNSRGYIYVNDRRRADVRVFDRSGRFITTIGKRGEGAGEMSEIVSMHIDGQDRLLVADRNSQRFTIFEDLGERFETIAFPEEIWGAPHPILTVGDAFVLRYVRALDDPSGKLPYIKDTKTLHLFDAALNHIETFADLGDMFNLDVPLEKELSDNQGALNMATNGIDEIVLVPRVYRGYVYRFVLRADAWHMAELRGGPVPRQSYRMVTKDEFDNDFELGRSSILVAGPSGVYRARVFNWSLGVAVLSTGEIVNFTLQTPLRGELGHRAELFDATGQLLGYGPIRFNDSALNRNEEIMSDFEILWVDQNDRIYLRRPNERGFYVLSVAELVIQPE
ncbi:MAG: 6-bladed beta-propeller [Bacteroidota bacterium]|nr:6-bladed beta-propeller [Bacteroidota bacterium]